MPDKTPTKQWSDAIDDAKDAIQRLINLQAECQGQYDAMTEKQLESEKASALSQICDLGLQEAMDNIDEAAECEIPKS